MIDVRWYGRGGQGAFTAANLLGRIMSIYKGSYALANPSFGPERRGAPVWCFTRIDDEKILDRGQPNMCNYLIVLDETLIDKEIFNVLNDDGVAIINTANPEKHPYIKQKVVNLDAMGLALKVLGKPITNVAMLGAFAGVSGVFDLQTAGKAIDDFFAPELSEKNKNLFKEAYIAVTGGGKNEQA